MAKSSASTNVERILMLESCSFFSSHRYLENHFWNDHGRSFASLWLLYLFWLSSYFFSRGFYHVRNFFVNVIMIRSQYSWCFLAHATTRRKRQWFLLFTSPFYFLALTTTSTVTMGKTRWIINDSILCMCYLIRNQKLQCESYNFAQHQWKLSDAVALGIANDDECCLCVISVLDISALNVLLKSDRLQLFVYVQLYN